jgi:hypothetical protein
MTLMQQRQQEQQGRHQQRQQQVHEALNRGVVHVSR